MTTVELACRTALAIVMGLAALGKLRASRELVAPMRAMGLPNAIAKPIAAIGVAVVELGAMVALLVAPLVGYVVVLALLAAFSAGLVSAIRRRTTVACRCFGASAQPIGAAHLVRNGVLCAIAITGLVTLGPGRPQWLAIVPGALASLAIIAWDEVVFAFAAPRRRAAPSRRSP